MESVFAKYHDKVWQYRYAVTLLVYELHGGIPKDPKKAEGWLKTKLGPTHDDLIRSMVADIMADDELTIEEATQQALERRHLNGFRRDAEQGLFIEGRQVKAMIKEAANTAWPGERWGPSKKGTRGFFAEHVFVGEDRIPLGVIDPSGIHQRFVHTYKGSGIQYEEFVEDAKVNFTVATDYKFKDAQWGELWTRAESLGVGASRSLGFGKFVVIKWEPTK